MLGNEGIKKKEDSHNGDFEHDAVNVDASEVQTDTKQQQQGQSYNYSYDQSPFHTGYPDTNPNYATSATGTYTYPTAPQGQDDLKKSQERAKYLGKKASDFVANHGGSHLMVFIMSFLLLVQASSDIHDINETNLKISKKGLGFAVFLGLISMLLITTHFVGHKKPDVVTPNIRLLLLFVVFALWVVGVGVLTFGDTYDTTGNGFFATWGAFFFVFQLMMSEFQQAEMFVERFKIFGWQLGTLLISSVVLLVASISPCKGTCSRGTKFALIMGIISTIYCILIFFFLSRLSEKVKLGVLGLLAILWAFIAFIGTFVGPFSTTGNGYFACWIGLGASVLLLHNNMHTTLGDSSPQSNVV